MSRKRTRSFDCTLVNEIVQIFLCRRQRGMKSTDLLVQCDQSECQYVDKNELPCPLTLEMFAEEVREQEERAKQRLPDKENY